MKGNEIREKFLEFFKEKGHTVKPSSSLVPEDPTVLLTIAGMIPFKSVFTGETKPNLKRVATSQRCLRTNDIENVGATARHHTFFEMLGNFSFGDYGKREAIKWAWEFLVRELKMPKEKLWISIYEDDEEAFDIWHKQEALSKSRIVRLGSEHNFWAIGPTGPCGPSSEIIYDRGAKYGCGKPGCGVGCNCDRFLEIWNLVFMEYNRDQEGSLKPLPRKNIDTGMGLERLAMIFQEKENTCASDLFQPIIDYTASLVKVAYGRDKIKDLALHIIADHIRAIVFLIYDGVLPANTGRGYVLRRIIRRALVQGRSLGLTEPYLHKLISIVIDIMKKPYPDLAKDKEHIERVVLAEEKRFLETLEKGLSIFDELLLRLAKEKKTQVPGDKAFELYDTYGIPVDLTREVAKKHKLTVDKKGFDMAMKEQKKRGRMAWQEIGQFKVKTIYNRMARELKATKFQGYDKSTLKAEILAIIKGDKKIGEAKKADVVDIILDVTPFYPEAGGQVGDKGILTKEATKIEILDTRQALPGLIVHRAKIIKGSIKEKEKIEAAVDIEKRCAAARNHTATHLLQGALKRILGKHVRQTGSFVSCDRLRFDFSHFAPLTDTQLSQIEELVNEKIMENIEVKTALVDFAQAKKEGALFLPGEKYDKRVRTLKIADFSLELCGGTHVRRTGDIGFFQLEGEHGIAAGVRRIEAVTGKEAYKLVKFFEKQLSIIAQQLKVRPFQASERLNELHCKLKEYQKEVERLKKKVALTQREGLINKAKTVMGVKVISENMERLDINGLRAASDLLKDKLKSGVIILGSVVDEKVGLVCVVTGDLIDRLDACQIIQEVARIVEGSGGGRKDFAQAGGKCPARLNQALKEVPRIIEKKLK
jgi:alanyl-tRNA synthetase